MVWVQALKVFWNHFYKTDLHSLLHHYNSDNWALNDSAIAFPRKAESLSPYVWSKDKTIWTDFKLKVRWFLLLLSELWSYAAVLLKQFIKMLQRKWNEKMINVLLRGRPKVNNLKANLKKNNWSFLKYIRAMVFP